MMPKVSFLVFTLLVLSQAEDAARKSQSACHCSPVINLSVDSKGQCDLCKGNHQLFQEMDDLKKELAAVKEQVQQASTGLPQSTPQSTYDLYFTKSGTSDYVIHHGLQITDAFTVCYRMRTTEKTVYDAAVLSYSANQVHNEILIKDADSLELWINDELLEPGVTKLYDGFWHLMCASWENKAGSWKIYKDGVSEASGSGLQIGHVIGTDGILTIGQDQDSHGGDFDASQGYIGELTDLNMWNRVLNATEILKLSKSCHGGEGNVKKWSDFKVGIRGDLRVVSPSACEI